MHSVGAALSSLMLEWDDIEFQNVARLLALLGFLALGFGCLAAMLGRVWWVFELASHFMLPLLILAVLVFGLFAWQRLWRLASVTAVLLFWILIQVVPYLIDTGGEDAAGKEMYRFVGLNLLLENRQAGAVLKYIEAEQPDVLLLQEVTPFWERRLRDSLRGEFPHQVLQTRTHAFGIWLLSKYPLDEIQVLPTDDANVPHVSAVIELDNQRVHFIGVHPLPPTGQSKARERNVSLAQAGQSMRHTTGPSLLLGDLNTTPWSPYYRKLLRAGRLRDSARWKGWHPTWNPGLSWLQLPIDHCLVSKQLGVAERRVGPEVGSDHRGVAVDVFFR